MCKPAFYSFSSFHKLRILLTVKNILQNLAGTENCTPFGVLNTYRHVLKIIACHDNKYRMVLFEL